MRKQPPCNKLVSGDGIKEENHFKQYVLEGFRAQIHPKLWLTGIIFALATWFRFDLGHLLMLMNLLGISHMGLTYWQLRSDGGPLRGAMFRFSLYTMLAFAATVTAFIASGKTAAVYTGYFTYTLFSIDYVFNLWAMLTGTGAEKSG